MSKKQPTPIERLLEKGVAIPAPESIEIDDAVDIDRISGEGVVFHAGTKVLGKETLILRNVTLGLEGPVTVSNCRIGSEVSLKGGYFKDAVFLRGASAGSGAHVREGTIFEEQASIAHTVALKQTILFPFVTLGSLINFCDVFMAGGTSRKNHSEVGSSYIHFNFTPNQDKATASLLGDVPGGVMLNQPPIFLGGQGGLVGPCRLAFGTTIAAGSIVRKDELRPGRLIFEGGGRGGNMANTPGYYRTIKRIVRNNIVFVANLLALREWYREIRSLFIDADFPEALYQGLLDTVQVAISERIRRLDALAEKMPRSIAAYQRAAGEKASTALLGQKRQFSENWPMIKEVFENQPARRSNAAPQKDRLIQGIAAGIDAHGKDYLAAIQSLEGPSAAAGTAWLQAIVDRVTRTVMAHLPTFGA